MVSVIIPVYNGAEYIKEMIRCLENQKHRDFEAIFIDDGSTDDSYAVIKQYEGRVFFKLVLYRQANAGVSAARNKGIELATGDYMCFVDVDDSITVDYLSDMYDVLLKNQCDMVICDYYSVIRDEDCSAYLSSKDQGSIKTVDNNTALYDFLYGRIVTGVCFLMVKRQLIVSNNLEFANGFKYSEDLHMTYRLLAHSDRVAYLDKKLYIYRRIRYASAMSKFNEERFHGLVLMQELEDYFDRLGLPFAKSYRKYGASRIVWSILWQAAVHFNRKEFIQFCKEHNTRSYLKKLITFKSPKVSGSALIYLLSESVYYYVARFFGRHLIKD